jgi:tRNA dimethylallyltransferase
VNSQASNRACPLVAIIGPTGSGKSSLGLLVAEHYDGEIVNCDSLQVYRGLDIGTAKTPARLRRGIPHHLFDVLPLDESYSAGEYARHARSILEEISGRRRLPVIAGGTGFYFRALLEGLPPLPSRDDALRARLLNRESRRRGSLHRLLKRLSPESAARIHANDIQKTVRALEIRLLTKAPAPESRRGLQGFKVIKIGLDPEREALRNRIDIRTKTMFETGLLEEMRGLLAGGATGAEKPFESIGYKQALRHLRGEISLEEAIASTQLETRQYAKRQMTWFRREQDVFWIKGFGDEHEAQQTALAHIARELEPA